MNAFFTYFSAFSGLWLLFRYTNAPVGSNKSLLNMYRFDRAKSTKMKFAFLGSALYRTLKKRIPSSLPERCARHGFAFSKADASLFVFFDEFFAFHSLRLDHVQRLRSLLSDLFRLSHVGRIAEDGVFFPVQELFHHTRIIDIGGRGD